MSRFAPQVAVSPNAFMGCFPSWKSRGRQHAKKRPTKTFLVKGFYIFVFGWQGAKSVVAIAWERSTGQTVFCGYWYLLRICHRTPFRGAHVNLADLSVKARCYKDRPSPKVKLAANHRRSPIHALVFEVQTSGTCNNRRPHSLKVIDSHRQLQGFALSGHYSHDWSESVNVMWIVNVRVIVWSRRFRCGTNPWMNA